MRLSICVEWCDRIVANSTCALITNGNLYSYLTNVQCDGGGDAVAPHFVWLHTHAWEWDCILISLYWILSCTCYYSLLIKLSFVRIWFVYLLCIVFHSREMPLCPCGRLLHIRNYTYTCLENCTHKWKKSYNF